jgi:hypothetical protein
MAAPALLFKFQFIAPFIVGNGLCAVPENVRQMARNDTQVVPYKVFAFYANTSINRNLNRSSEPGAIRMRNDTHRLSCEIVRGDTPPR